MTSQRRNRDISSAGIAPERITGRSQTPSIHNVPIKYLEMAARMEAILTMDIWKAEPAMSRPAASSCEEEVAVDIFMTDEDERLTVRTKDERPARFVK